MAGHELVWGVQGAEPPETQGFYTFNYRQTSIFYTLFVSLAGHKLVLGAGPDPPETQGFYTLNYRQMCIFLYPICDTGRLQIGVWSRGRSRWKLRCFGQ